MRSGAKHPATLDEIVPRLLHVRSPDAPVVSVYVAVPPDRRGARTATSRIHDLVKPARELGESDELGHDERMSLRADVERVLAVVPRIATFQGRALGLFTCTRAGLYEEVVLPRRVRDRLVLDATPYLRPLLAALDESHRYCAVVVERDRAWLFEIDQGDIEDARTTEGRALRKRDYAGWHGLAEPDHD